VDLDIEVRALNIGALHIEELPPSGPLHTDVMDDAVALCDIDAHGGQQVPKLLLARQQ